jgi:hypothetical protein
MLSASALSAAIFNRATSSASIASASASASASGMSGMVSRDEMLGLRERKLVGVDGIEDVEDVETPGYGSLNLVASMMGEECTDPGLLEVFPVTLETLLCNDDVDCRRLGLENVFCSNEGNGVEGGGCSSF